MAGDLLYHARRPLFLIWIFIVVLSSWGMSTGSMQIQSGDTAVGGTKAWITSEFAVAMQLAVLTMLCYAFFLAIAAGLTMIQDEEWRLNELLHSTPLTPDEYVWAKFAAVLVGALAVLAIHVAAMIFFFHVMPNSEASEIRGPFQMRNYLRPALIFSAPTIVFLAGTSLAVGEWTRRTILVFLLPLAIFLVDLFFLWTWSPSWLDPRLNRALALLDPTGFRWLNETWLKDDRGVNFYNTAAIPTDLPFLVSRGVIALLGVVAAAVSRWHFGAVKRGSSSRPIRRRAKTLGKDVPAPVEAMRADP